MSAPHFPDPEPPYPSVVVKAHEHDLYLVGADLQRNGTWSSRWACTMCPDHFAGAHIGPVPSGWCRCGWVSSADATVCEECGRPVEGELS